MSLQTIEIEAFSGPTSVLIGGGNQPTIVYINQGPAGTGSAVWGGITGTLSSQTDLQDALDLKANLESPTFTGTVSGITKSMVGLSNVDNTSDVNKPVSTAQQTALDLKANLESPTFTGIVTAPRIEGKCAGLELFSKAGQAINAGQVVYVTGASGTNVIVGLAQANTESTSSRTIGVCESNLALNATGYVITEGLMTVSISSATALVGDPIWLSGTTAGGMLFGAANKPVYPYHVVYLGVVTRKTGNTIVEIYVKVQNGFELDELSDVLITTPLANQALVRNSDKWINRALVSNDISDSSTGGNGAADAGKLVEFNSTGGVAFEAITANSSISTSGDVAVISTSGSDANINTSGANAAISTSGSDASINTSGANAPIYTGGANATITTYGPYANISTFGTAAYISTAGANAYISTTGAEARITTDGAQAYIATSGIDAYIQTRATFNLFNGTHTTTLSHNPTSDRAIAFPNAAGTVALINPSSGTQTFSGAQIFDSTTRPTSSGTGTPAATSLITLADSENAKRGWISFHCTNFTGATNVKSGGTSESATLGFSSGASSATNGNYNGYRYGTYMGMNPAGDRAIANFDRRTIFRASMLSPNTASVTGEARYLWPVSTSYTTGRLTTKGIGFVFIGNKVYGHTHDGTTALITTGFVDFGLNANLADCVADSNGSGTVDFYVNGTLLGSLTGPTGTQTNARGVQANVQCVDSVSLFFNLVSFSLEVKI